MRHTFDLLSLSLNFVSQRPESALPLTTALDRAERTLSDWAHVEPGSDPGTLSFWVRYRSGRSWLTRIYRGHVRAAVEGGRTTLEVHATLLPLMTLCGTGFLVVGVARDELALAVLLAVLFGVANYAILYLWLRSVMRAVLNPLAGNGSA